MAEREQERHPVALAEHPGGEYLGGDEPAAARPLFERALASTIR